MLITSLHPKRRSLAWTLELVTRGTLFVTIHLRCHGSNRNFRKTLTLQDTPLGILRLTAKEADHGGAPYFLSVLQSFTGSSGGIRGLKHFSKTPSSSFLWRSSRITSHLLTSRSTGDKSIPSSFTPLTRYLVHRAPACVSQWRSLFRRLTAMTIGCTRRRASSRL